MADLSQFTDSELQTAHAVTSAIDAAGGGAPNLSNFTDDQLRTAQRVTQSIDQAQATKAPASAPEEPLGHKIIREAVPVAGQILGGLSAGAVAAPETMGVGAIPAAMAGGAAGNIAGNEAASWLNHEIYGDEAPTYNSLDDAKRIGTEGAIGAAAELGGQVTGKLVEGAGGAISKAVTKAPEMISKEVETGLLDSAGQPITKTVQEQAPSQPGIGSKIAQALPDLASSAIGHAVMGPVGIVAGPVAKRAISPILEKPIAVAADGISQVLERAPSFFGKWAPALSAAAARGTAALNANIYVLQQQDPEFRQKMQELNNSPSMPESHGTSD